MENRIVLNEDQDTGNPFTSPFQFMVYFITYTDGWYVEFADAETPDDERLWHRYNQQPLQNTPGESFIIVPGSRELVFRMNGGTQGAVVKITNIKLLTS